jgi:hypothetical protein
MAQVQLPFNWKDAEILNFKVVNEDWQLYELSDKSQLRIKLVLTQVWKGRTQVNLMTGEPLYMWNTINAVSLLSFPEELRGQPTTTPITPEMLGQNIEKPVDYELSGKQDEWNVYNLSDGSVLRLRLNLTSITRTKVRGAAGEPIYSIGTGLPNYRMKVPDELIKKPTSQMPTKAKDQLYG